MFITQWGRFGDQAGEFQFPDAVTVDSANNVYVTSAFVDRIQKFDSSGLFLIEQWGGTGTEPGQFAYPIGLAVDSQDHVYVVDTNNHRIQKFDSQGNFIVQWGRNTLKFPTGIAIDSSDHIYVTDTRNQRVHKFGDTTTTTVTPSPVFRLPSVPICATDTLSINSVCKANHQALRCGVTIEKYSSISQAIFVCDAQNKGWISNSTITTGTTVTGGTLTGFITNEGTLADFDFRGLSVIGGTLAGQVTNSSRVGGWFQDVHLAANAHLSGGRLKGTITGEIDAPAVLEHVEIKAGAQLSGVIIGDNVRIDQGVEFGAGVIR